MYKLFEADKILVTTFFLLVIIGFLFFLSATLGIFASNPDKFISVLKSQIFLGFILGFIGFFLVLRIKVSFWQKYAMFFFIASLVLTSLVYVPGLSMYHGGAYRWVDLGFVSFQPVEFLKAGIIIYLSAVCANLFRNKENFDIKNKKIKFNFKNLLPIFIIFLSSSVLLYFQPDTKNIVIIALTIFLVLFISGLSSRFLVGALVLFLVMAGIIYMTRPHVVERFITFLNPTTENYQVEQALIAFGSGGLTGQGIGQSVQKFNFLPEPHGDSVFAVVGEEIGFIGSVVIIFLYATFVLRGIKLSQSLKNIFGRFYLISFFLVFGIQAFLNIGSITKTIPLTGVPLPLMSHGGTSFLVTIVLFGIVIRFLYEDKLKSS